MAKIIIEFMSDGWVRIENGGGGFKTSDFLNKHRKHMENVSFGDRGIQGSLAIKHHRVPRFIEFAKKSGFEVFWKGDEVILRTAG